AESVGQSGEGCPRPGGTGCDQRFDRLDGRLAPGTCDRPRRRARDRACEVTGGAPVTATSSRPGLDGDPGTGLGDVADLCGRIAGNVQRVIVGKPEVVRVALVTLLAEGHLLVEDVPGVGKTSL